MNYKISDIAKIFNVSTETIRYYESKGIIQSKRNKENNYRYFDDWSILDLANYLYYKKFDFSIEETKMALESGDAHILCETMEDKVDELEKKIQHDQIRLRWMKWRVDQIRNFDLNIGRIIITQLPNFYYLNSFSSNGDNLNIHDEGFIENIHELTSKDPFTMPILISSLDKIHDNDNSIKRGYMIFEKYANMLKLELSDTTLVSKQTYITYLASVENLDSLSEITKPLFDFMKENTYKVKNEIFGLFVLRMSRENRHKRYVQFMIPIE